MFQMGLEGDDETGGRQDERRDLGFGEKSEATWAMGHGQGRQSEFGSGRPLLG